MNRQFLISLLFLVPGLLASCARPDADGLKVNELEYLEMRGLNVMLAHDFYPEGHQGGVSIIQNGLRVATNGDIRLEPSPGQWSPIPKPGTRVVDPEHQEISVVMTYPDSSRHRRGFNPIIYPDLYFKYTLRVRPEGRSFRILVDLEEPLPAEWVGKVGFNLELFPGILFGKSFRIGDQVGIFPRQANGPVVADGDGEWQIEPLGRGKKLLVAPEEPAQRMTIENLKGELELIDSRGLHNNGWFIVRSLVPAGAAEGAVEWLVSPEVIENFTYGPVVQLSQVGYHPKQEKVAVIETDINDLARPEAQLYRLDEGSPRVVLSAKPQDWGKFLRYQYLLFDFSSVTETGMYRLKYGDYTTEPFQIGAGVYKRHVWQPTLEYYLPVQMCHMRVNDRYKVWHDHCHMDDALMAPVDTNHFDGYLQGPSTLTRFKPMEHVPGLDQGGWHDAGDYDLRVESQAGEVHILSMIWEEFGVDYDETTIDQAGKLVEMHRPDGVPDVLQQIEHGVLTIVGGYRSLGRFYRGLIEPYLRQYVLLGEAAQQTDNIVKDGRSPSQKGYADTYGQPDDRWVFTEDNPRREVGVAVALAAAGRSLAQYRPALAAECLGIAEKVWREKSASAPSPGLVELAVELYQTTARPEYAEYLTSNGEYITSHIARTGWTVGKVLPALGDEAFAAVVRDSVRAHRDRVEELQKINPYGVPYEPNIWGAGWGIQRFGVEQYYFHTGYPDIFPDRYMHNALHFVLGRHPGVNTSSFASGVGSRSLLVAYGTNRDEWSYIPGGVGSGTALIRPDFPEMLEWPYLWQQTEYVMGGGATNFMFLALAADHLLSR